MSVPLGSFFQQLQQRTGPGFGVGLEEFARLLKRLGNPQNILNRWCFISGMIFSLGVFKEYLYFTLFPWLIRAFPSVFTEEGALTVYSALTGFFYYFSMPPALVFGLYFDHFDRRHPRLFPWLKAALFLPGILFGLFFPYGQTRYFSNPCLLK